VRAFQARQKKSTALRSSEDIQYLNAKVACKEPSETQKKKGNVGAAVGEGRLGNFSPYHLESKSRARYAFREKADSFTGPKERALLKESTRVVGGEGFTRGSSREINKKKRKKGENREGESALSSKEDKKLH